MRDKTCLPGTYHPAKEQGLRFVLIQREKAKAPSIPAETIAFRQLALFRHFISPGLQHHKSCHIGIRLFESQFAGLYSFIKLFLA